MTFFSAHHSPSTVNMNASEFVIGTVRLNSTNCELPKVDGKFNLALTSLANQYKEPYTASDIEQQRNGIRRPTQNAFHGIPNAESLPP